MGNIASKIISQEKYGIYTSSTKIISGNNKEFVAISQKLASKYFSKSKA